MYICPVTVKEEVEDTDAVVEQTAKKLKKLQNVKKLKNVKRKLYKEKKISDGRITQLEKELSEKDARVSQLEKLLQTINNEVDAQLEQELEYIKKEEQERGIITTNGQDGIDGWSSLQADKETPL